MRKFLYHHFGWIYLYLPFLKSWSDKSYDKLYGSSDKDNTEHTYERDPE